MLWCGRRGGHTHINLALEVTTAHVRAYIGPGNTLWPPDGFAVGFAPSGFTAAHGGLQHFRDERSQLGLVGVVGVA